MENFRSFSYLNKFILSKFVSDISCLNPKHNIYSINTILCPIYYKQSSLFDLHASLLNKNSLFSSFTSVTNGRFFVFFLFLYSNIAIAYRNIKTLFILIILQKTNSNLIFLGKI